VSENKLKVGVERGGGPPPGYLWRVLVFDNAYREAMSFLKAYQYRHLALQVQELAREQDPSHSETVDVQPIEDFHELRDRGGVLANLNVRVFFGIDKSSRDIVVLGAINKQNNGPTPKGDKVRMRRRWRKYQSGE
jgi:hypothetical protein